MTKREHAALERRIKRSHAARVARDRLVLSRPGLKQFLFIIGPYQFLEKEWGTPWLHLFVAAKSKAEAIRLKKASDARCSDTIRGRRHKWHVIPFNVGEVLLA